MNDGSPLGVILQYSYMAAVLIGPTKNKKTKISLYGIYRITAPELYVTVIHCYRQIL
jgi:hypothetical protein